MNNQEFDNKIKKHFSERELQVSTDAFERLELESVTENTSSKFIWLRVAAAVILLLGVGYFFNNKEAGIEITDTDKEVVKPKTITEESIKEVVITKQSVKINEEKQEIKEVIATIKPKTKLQIVANTPSKVIAKELKPVQQFAQTTVANPSIKPAEKVRREESVIVQTFNTDVVLDIDIAAGLSKKKYKVDASSLLKNVEQSIAQEQKEEIRFREKAFQKIKEGVNYVSLALVDTGFSPRL